MTRALPAFLRAGPEADQIDGRVLALLTRIVLATSVASANVIGAVVVVVLALLVIPLPEGQNFASGLYVAAAAVYVAAAVVVGVVVGIRGQRQIVQWLKDGEQATPAIRASILGLPLRLYWLQWLLWLGGALVFGLVAAIGSGERGLWVGVVVGLTGATTAALAYLLVERLTRPVAARAMVGADPSEVGSSTSVARRNVLAWAMGGGIPTAGLLILGIRAFAPSTITVHEFAIATVVLAGTALLVGARAVLLAAQATSDPINGVAEAMARVHKGDYETRVAVYDGTEIGRLQLGFNEMVAGLAEREQIRSAFGTYVDPTIAEHILSEGTDLSGEEIELSMLFIDIRNFAGFAEQTPAREVVGTINRLFARAVPLIREHGGHVDKFVGDGLLAVFGAPGRLDNHAESAVMASLDIADAVIDEFGDTLSVGIGVNTGTVVAGNVGGAGRFEFSVIGDPVNVAARIESATRQTGDTILIADRTRELLDSASVSLTERPDVELKGKSGTAALFAVAR